MAKSLCLLAIVASLLEVCVALQDKSEATFLGDGRLAMSLTQNTRMPESIWRLAVKLLGREGAKQLDASALANKIVLAGRHCTLWSTKSDDTATAVPQEFGGHTCAQTCIKYKYPELAQKPAGIAVDVGGNIGDTSILALARNPKLQLMTFEASPQTYVLLKWNILENSIPEITEDDITSGSGKSGILAIHAAFTGDGKPVEFKFAPERSYNAMMASNETAWGGEVTSKKTHFGTLNWETFKVPGFSLVDWFTKHNVPKPVWFKIDCEGCEYDTLLAVHSAGILDNALVVGEAHPRKLKDSSCKDDQSRPDCKTALSVMQDTKNIMCQKYEFVGCNRVVNCGAFQEHC